MFPVTVPTLNEPLPSAMAVNADAGGIVSFRFVVRLMPETVLPWMLVAGVWLTPAASIPLNSFCRPFPVPVIVVVPVPLAAPNPMVLPVTLKTPNTMVVFKVIPA